MRNLLTLLVFALFVTSSAHAEDEALARVQKNQEINCGVYVLGSIFSYDPNGNPQGFTADLMKEISERTGTKVKYTEISSFATIFEDLRVGHYDMICSPILLIPATAMKALPGDFLLEDPVNIYTDGSVDTSIFHTFEQLNDPKYTFVGMDGELGGIYVPKLFPKAKLNLLPLGTPPSNMMMEVHTKKANFLVLSRLAEKAYLKERPGQLKKVTDQSILQTSIRLFFAQGSPDLKANIDAIVDDMKRDGTFDTLVKKHGL